MTTAAALKMSKFYPYLILTWIRTLAHPTQFSHFTLWGAKPTQKLRGEGEENGVQLLLLFF